MLLIDRYIATLKCSWHIIILLIGSVTGREARRYYKVILA